MLEQLWEICRIEPVICQVLAQLANSQHSASLCPRKSEGTPEDAEGDWQVHKASDDEHRDKDLSLRCGWSFVPIAQTCHWNHCQPQCCWPIWNVAFRLTNKEQGCKRHGNDRQHIDQHGQCLKDCPPCTEQHLKGLDATKQLQQSENWEEAHQDCAPHPIIGIQLDAIGSSDDQWRKHRHVDDVVDVEEKVG